MWKWFLKLIPVAAKASPVALALCLGAAGAWYVTSDHYETKLRKLELDTAMQVEKQRVKYHEKLVQATEQLDLAQHNIVVLSGDRDRLRRDALSAQRRARALASQNMDSGAVTECYRLLETGAGLLGRGSELLAEGADARQRDALRHDAVVRTIK